MYNDGLTDKDMTVRALLGWQWIRNNHGSLFDRGSADSYYGRPRRPHYGGIGGCPHPEVTDLSVDERNEYFAGYDWNEQFGDKKSWD